MMLVSYDAPGRDRYVSFGYDIFPFAWLATPGTILRKISNYHWRGP
jgi:hypothetical protein